MGKCACALLLVGLYTWCHGQTTQKTTPAASTQQPASTTPYPFPDPERGLIITVFHSYGDEDAAQIRHLPIYPGYENFSGSVPGIGFTNPNIHLLSIDVDYREKAIFSYDYHLRAIVVGYGFNKDLNVSQMDFDFMHVGVSKGTIQVAYDWLSKTLYWSDYVFRWIVAAPTEKEKIENDYYAIIADTHLDGPDGIAVDPLAGYLFWSDNGKHPKIERSDLKGNNRQSIIYKNLVSPLTLEADIFEKRIYWIDSDTEAILSATYDGKDIIQIQRIPSAGLLDLAIFREVIYVSDITNSDVYTLNKTKGLHLGKSESTDISIFPEIIYGLAVYGSETQPLKDKDYCAEKMCEHICVSTETGAECICSVGFEFNKAGKCEEVVTDYHKAIVTANATHICLVDIRSFGHVYYDYVCKYSAIKQTKPQNSPTTSPVPPVRRKRQDVSTPKQTTTPQTKQPPTTVPTTTTTLAPTAAPGDLIKMFDMHMENRIIYFATVSNTIYKRPIDLPIENDVKELVVVASGNISGLAFDATNNNNLYWCESDTGNVRVIDVATMATRRVTLDNMEVNNPRDLIVMLDQGRLAMLTGFEGEMSIQTMTMDGQDYKTVLSNRDISAFAYDMENRLFYYVSGINIYSVSHEGSDRKTSLYGVDRNIFRLVLYKNYLSYLFTDETYAHLLRTYDIVTKTNIALGYFDNSSIADLKVLDTKLQTVDFISPCKYENGNCSQICITKFEQGQMTAVCECRLGYKLASNGKSCNSSVVNDTFILVTDWTNEVVMQINLANNEINAIPDDSNSEYMGIYYDPDKKKVIYAEYYDSKIISMNLNGTERQLLSDLGYSGYAYRFDKDRTTQNLYYTSYYDTYVGAVLPSGDYIVLIDSFSFYASLGDIVVHPGKGWMYYTATDWTAPYVGRSDMDGKNSVKLIIGDHVDTPDGLAIDYRNDHLYWSDATFDTIIRCDLNGQNCVTIINMTSTYRNEEIRDMVIDGDFLYYSAYKKDHVVRVDLATDEFTRTIVGQNVGLGKLDTLAYFSSKNTNTQPASPGCRDRKGLGDCSTVCFPTPTGRTCACERGVSLKADGRTCSNIYQCTDVIKQPVQLISNEREMVDVTFDESCLRHLDDKCDYRCPVNFIPLYKTSLTCTKVGWDLESKTLCQVTGNLPPPEIRCPANLANGIISKNCKREIGDKCDYTCNNGFVKSQQTAVCTKDRNGSYHLSDDELCIPFQCNATIRNGKLGNSCSRNIGSSCKYTCNRYYTPSDKKSTAVCKSSGWNPSTPCIENQCEDDSLAFGQVTGSCSKTVGDACRVQCNRGYVNTTALTVCKNDFKWHPETTCMPVRCSSTIQNGDIDVFGSCDLSVGKTCRYTCRYGFKAADVRANLLCTVTGQWNVTDGLCSEVSISPSKMQQEENVSVTGVALGVVLLVLVIIALVVAIIFLIRRNRNKPSSNYASASFHQNGGGGGIAIENPGYLQANEPTIQVKDEHPYSSVDPSQMQPVAFAEGAIAADDGIVNPMYNKEPLPDVGHVEMNQDKTVLTYDSWLKEREREKK